MKLNIAISLILASLIPTAAAAQWPEGHAEDAPPTLLVPAIDPGYELGLKLVEESAFEMNGESDLLVFDASWAAAYFLDALFGGDVRLDFFLETAFLSDSTALKLPDQLLQFAMELGVTWQYENGMVFQADVAPGYYSDMKDFSMDAIFFPFSLSLAALLNPNLAGVIGVQVRPEFERSILPIIGIDWDINEKLDLQLQVPQTRFTWYAARSWIFYLGLDWISESYALEKSSTLDRKMLTMESIDMEAGILYRLSDEMRLALVYGESTDREVEFEKTGMKVPRVSDIDDGQYFRIGILGPF